MLGRPKILTPSGSLVPARSFYRGGPGSDRTARSWPKGAAVALAIIATSGSAISACSSSPASSAPSATCQQVSAVLANGPDPDADPVGYAQAQILPLQQVHSSDDQLTRSLSDLESAYQNVVDTNGSASAKKAATGAADALNKLCPGAGAEV
jgi:hypothetical protein